jgi:hypothetical protein
VLSNAPRLTIDAAVNKGKAGKRYKLSLTVSVGKEVASMIAIKNTLEK